MVVVDGTQIAPLAQLRVCRYWSFSGSRHPALFLLHAMRRASDRSGQKFSGAVVQFVQWPEEDQSEKHWRWWSSISQ